MHYLSELSSTLAENPSCNPECRVCHYKSLDYPTQLHRKQEWAASQLSRWKDVLKSIRPAPENERIAYRSKSWMRSCHQPGNVSFGMYRSIRSQGRWEKEFVSWDSCPLHSEAIQLMIAKLRRALTHEVPEFIEKSLLGVWIGTPHLVIVSRTPNFEELGGLNWKEILVLPFDQVWFHCNPQIGRKVFGHHPIVPILGAPQVRLDSAASSIHPIKAFRQIAQGLLVEARKQAIEALLRHHPGLIVDLYCGTGDLSLLLPPHVGWLGIEISKEAVNYANSLRSSESTLHTAFAGAVEQRLRDPKVMDKISKPYALYLNPPRSGLTPEAREEILSLIRNKPPTSIIYLSCSASSLARDLEIFENAGYSVKRLQPFDFFPQTEHFEILAVLDPQAS
jgi:tRNA/tmRNA/rRNA uracil-C5-methylase (TrmA/RlmC/RlmD family)